MVDLFFDNFFLMKSEVYGQLNIGFLQTVKGEVHDVRKPMLTFDMFL